MRLREIFVAILAVVFVNSCSSYYYVTTDVEPDLSVERTVHMENEDYLSDFVSTEVWAGSDVSSPFEVDFYDQTSTMKKMYSSKADDIGGISFQPDQYQKGNPLFTPAEAVSKRFRWFYTYYDYRAEFKSLKDDLPLSLDGYITPEQRELFFKGENPPQGWNGLEMYYLLDDVNRKFAQWYSDAVFYTIRDILKPYCTKSQIALLDACKAEFMKDIDRDMVFVMEPDSFVERLVLLYPDAGFEEVYLANEQQLKDAYSESSKLISYFGYSFIYSVDLPGKYFEGNAVDFTDGNPSWKVDAFRLVDGNLVLEAVSRKINVWAFVLTFALIILLLQVFAKVFSKA